MKDTTQYTIIATSQGEAGAGKTHFWLTAPEPIAYFLLDPGGLKGLQSNPLFKGKDVRVLDCSGDLDFGRVARDKRVERGLEIMNRFDEGWDEAIGFAKTIVVDKEDKLWELRRYAHDEVDSPDPKSFAELNLEHAALIVQAEAAGINLGLIRGMKEVWGKTGISQRTGKATMGFTGESKPRGQKEVVENVQINLHHRWDEEDRAFKVKILDKCRLGEAVALLGEEFANLDFNTLAAMLYPDADPSEWGG